MYSVTFAFGWKQLDFHWKPEPYPIHPAEVNLLGSGTAQAIHVAYTFEIKHGHSDIGNLGKNFTNTSKFGFLATIITVACILGIDSLVCKQKMKISMTKCWKEYKSRLFFLSAVIFNQPIVRLDQLGHRFAAFNLLFVFFFWICCLLITNSVGSNLIVLDVSDLRNADLQHLMRTQRSPCWMADEAYLNAFIEADPKSVLAKFWAYGGKGKCLIRKNVQELSYSGDYKFHSYFCDVMLM